jgi:hypothetical protein
VTQVTQVTIFPIIFYIREIRGNSGVASLASLYVRKAKYGCLKELEGAGLIAVEERRFDSSRESEALDGGQDDR